jgi:hypothetical protein
LRDKKSAGKEEVAGLGEDTESGWGKRKDRFGFAEELGHELGGFLGNLLLVGDFGICIDFEDWHCEGILGR